MPLPPEAPTKTQETKVHPQAPGCKGRALQTLAWIAVLTWAATIYWFSSCTGPQIEELNVFEIWDKAAHFIAFFSGAPALVCALRWSTRWSWKRVAITAAAISVLYGAGDEIHQLYTPNRSGADVYDWTADSLGGIAGTIGTIFAYARLERSLFSRRRTT